MPKCLFCETENPEIKNYDEDVLECKNENCGAIYFAEDEDDLWTTPISAAELLGFNDIFGPDEAELILDIMSESYDTMTAEGGIEEEFGTEIHIVWARKKQDA